MRHLSPIMRGLCACLLGASLHAQAQSPTPPRTNGDAVVAPLAAAKQAREISQGDPARWYREDGSPQARLRTLQKEIGAALQEAENACKKAAAAERTACLREARAIYQRDLTHAQAQTETQATANPPTPAR
ncbi:hypothetical protein IM543_09230 [Massilia sp. UMI-21]|nr:hypothetical protein IM543_09230 [Massilia sp. UMI-21]